MNIPSTLCNKFNFPLQESYISYRSLHYPEITKVMLFVDSTIMLQKVTNIGLLWSNSSIQAVDFSFLAKVHFF